MKKIVRMFKQIWRLATPYWFKAPDRGGSWVLLILSTLMMLLSVLAIIRMNEWYLDWTNAYTLVDYAMWKHQLLVFFLFTAVNITNMLVKGYIDGWIQLRWRKWMVSTYIQDWMRDFNYYRMQFTGSQTDNPDQRISEDISTFIGSTWGMSFGLLQNLVMLGSFLVILWNLSNTIPLMLFGRDWSFPGYFIVISIIWAVLGTLIAHYFGRQLIGLNYNQTRYEADFRFSLVRVRENSEQIALLGGEKVEHGRLMGVFNNVVSNSFRIMMRNMKFGFANQGYSSLEGVLISLLLGPAYFTVGLPGGYGAIMQISMAHQTVNNTFSYFKNAYAGLAAWKAVINRLTGFLDSRERSEALLKESRIYIKEQDKDQITLPELEVYLPSGQLMITAKDIVIKPGEKVLIKGKTGAGKTTLFRVLSGLWPFGKGDVLIPKGKKVIVLPQKPYIPIGTLAEAVSYPEPPEKYTREEIIQVLEDVDLGEFVNRLDVVAHWNMVLSGGEQQRLGIARAMLYKPDYLFFDEATSSMDEPSEEVLYNILLERMKDTTIISIGHRSSLEKFHERMFVAEPTPAGNYEFVEKTEKAG